MGIGDRLSPLGCQTITCVVSAEKMMDALPGDAQLATYFGLPDTVQIEAPRLVAVAHTV